MNKLPVVAAIPNYNMATELGLLLPQLTEQGYADIFVLDDASTDYSREVVAEFSSDIQFIPGAQNKGAGANRNRIINALKYDAIIHFLDADVVVETVAVADKVRDTMPSQPVGFVGGLWKTSTGLQSVWNYGPRQNLKALLGSQVQSYMEPLLLTDPERASALRKRFSNLVEAWPDPLATPVRRKIFWNVEGNLAVDSAVFAKLNGFDETLREHEIQDLAIRMAGCGLPRYFDPLVSVRHTEGQVRKYNRSQAMLSAEFDIARKHGLLNWLLSR